MSELQPLIQAASDAAWQGEPARILAEAIEAQIVKPLPSRLRSGLAWGEAEQLARVLAWEAARDLAAKLPERAISWGYLANFVRWRVADAVRAEALRRRRHMAAATLPERPGNPLVPPLGDNLERIAHELELVGLPYPAAIKLLRIAADGPRYERAAIASRLQGSGVDRGQAEGMAWLLRGGAANRSALHRLSAGESAHVVFSDAVVRRWLHAAAGRDRGFRAGRTGMPMRRASAAESSCGLPRSA